MFNRENKMRKSEFNLTGPVDVTFTSKILQKGVWFNRESKIGRKNAFTALLFRNVR